MKKLTILGLFCSSLILVNAQSKIKYDLDNKIIELPYTQNQRLELKEDQNTYQLTGVLPSVEAFIDSRKTDMHTLQQKRRPTSQAGSNASRRRGRGDTLNQGMP